LHQGKQFRLGEQGSSARAAKLKAREDESMAPLRVALIGAGRRGRGAHLPVITRMKDRFELVAVGDVDPEAARAAEEYGARAYTSLRELVARERPDAAVVTVPGDAHHAVVWYLAEHGVHVLVETPIASTRPLSDLMIAAAARNRVVLEVAENYYRAPGERLKSAVITSGAIGKVSRLHRIFHEGGYHGMSLLRHHAGGQPTSVLGIAHETPVLPHTDRMKRHHTRESWSMGVIDFDNGALAVMSYSNVIHARSLGRGQTGIGQIDGTAGTILEEAVYEVPASDLESGARAVAHPIQRRAREVDGRSVLELLFVDLPGGSITWENPYARYALTEGQVSVADELESLARAVQENRPPEYGAARARQDQEMNLAMAESARLGRRPLTLPLDELTETEAAIHEKFRREYGHEAEDVEALVEHFFPRR
jgi:predicted dehydrogenase